MDLKLNNTQNNLFAALQAQFPADLDAAAVEVMDGPGRGLIYSWRDLDRASAKLANQLLSLGVPARDPDGVPPRIAVHADKSVECMLLYLATLRAGWVYLPLNTAYQQAELGYFIDNAKPSVVVCAQRNFGWVSKLAFSAGARAVYSLDDDRTGSLLERATHQSDVCDAAERGVDDLAAILYTSGTTGRSKGAMLTHGNLLSNALTLKDYWGWRHGDVLLHTLPIFHVHGLFVALHGALLNGSKMLWFNKFDPVAVTSALPRATVFMGVPTLYTRLLDTRGFGRDTCKNMRLFVAGSAPLQKETFADFEARTGHRILERYGMSETVMLTSNPYRAELGERRAGTVGFPLPGVSVRIASDAGRALSVGEVGGIEVRGPNVFKGYWQMPEKTAEEFTHDGYFKTGDVGLIDERGYVSIVGRSKDVIISGGYNVYPAEVEGYLNELEGVAESALVGVPHPDFGEVGLALVVAKPGASPDPAAISAALKNRIANFKIPKKVYVLPELPRNAMGKVQKAALRERYRAEFA
jgi:malonyl-CoA/methylmalonyl-CoA synthetase